MHTFAQFLVGVKYAFTKMYGHLDMLSMQKDRSDNRTLWEEVKSTGRYEFNLDGIAIDLEFGRNIYLAIKIVE